MRNKQNPNLQSIKKLKVQDAKASLASDFLAVLKQLIESEEDTIPEEDRCRDRPGFRNDGPGRNQPVGEYPDSSLRYKGGGPNRRRF